MQTPTRLKLTPAAEKAHIKTIQTKFAGKSQAAVSTMQKLGKESKMYRAHPTSQLGARAAKKLYLNFNKDIKGKSLVEVKIIEKKYLTKLRKLIEQTKERIEAGKMKEKLLTAVTLHVTSVREEFNKEYKTYNKTQKKYVEKEHLDMLVNAYLVRWQKSKYRCYQACASKAYFANWQEFRS